LYGEYSEKIIGCCLTREEGKDLKISEIKFEKT
jgi:hypothetical protein